MVALPQLHSPSSFTPVPPDSSCLLRASRGGERSLKELCFHLPLPLLFCAFGECAERIQWRSNGSSASWPPCFSPASFQRPYMRRDFFFFFFLFWPFRERPSANATLRLRSSPNDCSSMHCILLEGRTVSSHASMKIVRDFAFGFFLLAELAVYAYRRAPPSYSQGNFFLAGFQR